MCVLMCNFVSYFVCVILCIFVFLCDILLPAGVINDDDDYTLRFKKCHPFLFHHGFYKRYPISIIFGVRTKSTGQNATAQNAADKIPLRQNATIDKMPLRHNSAGHDATNE